MNKLFLLIILIFGIETSFSQTKIDTLQQNLLTTKNEKLRLTILDTLVKEMMQSNHPNQMKYLKELINIAKRQEKYDLAAEKSRFIIQNYTNKGQLDSTLHVIKSMLAIKEKYKKKSSEAHLLLKRGSYYYNKGELNKASMDYDIAGDLFLKSGDSIFTADARFFAGQVYVDSNNFLKSVKRFEKAYELYDLLGDKDYSNYTLNELSILYGKNDFNDKAIKERNRILSDAKKLKNNTAIAYAYYHLNTSYTKKNELDIAKKYIDSLAISINNIKDLTKKKNFNINLSIVYVSYFIKSNSLDSVPKYLKQIDKQLTLSNAPNHQKNLLLFYSAKYYKKRKQYTKAQEFLEKFLNNKSSDVQKVLNAKKELSKVYAIQNKYQKAYKHLKNYTDAKDLDNSKIKTNTFLYYQSQFESQRKDNEIYKKKAEIALLEKDKQIANSKRKILWIFIISIILLSIIISYYVWKKGKQKRKILAVKIEKNKAELKQFTQLLIEKGKTQETLTKEIENLKEKIGTQESTEKLQDLTTIKILTNEDWYNFKQKFKNVYPNFFVSIKNRGFDLTKSEERLLAMEKLYLDTNEIASMLAISRDSVTKSRSRLRKKINAPKGSSILDYLEAS